jgi:hypothetical protein
MLKIRRAEPYNEGKTLEKTGMFYTFLYFFTKKKFLYFII